MNVDIPYRKIGVDPHDGQLVVSEVQRSLKAHPGASVVIQQVSEATGVPAEITKTVFYTLLTLRCLKATFLPRHRNCDRPLGRPENSVYAVLEKIDSGAYFCMPCGVRVLEPEEVDIQLLFWGPSIHGK